MSHLTEDPPSTESMLPPDGILLDYITGKPKRDSPKEQVRQRLARALFHEYLISPEDMAADFPLSVEGRRRRVDLAIFNPGAAKEMNNIARMAVCAKEPANGKKGAFRMRDHQQAEKDLRELQELMLAAPNCRYGLWTNGIERFFLKKEKTRFDYKFDPIGDWPLGDESVGSRDVASEAYLRRADEETLRTAFRRCHNFIHGNEGMPKDAAFWQFLYLIYTKMYDEQQRGGRRFWAHPTEQFDPKGRKAIRERIVPLFEEVKNKSRYKALFKGKDEITLSDRALAFMVSELGKYDFSRTPIDAKGAAYQEIVKGNLRGDRGQYFTPRGAVDLMVQMLDPQPEERILDPACGTGGFLVSVLKRMSQRFHEEAKTTPEDETTDEFLSIQDRLAQFARGCLFGADFDPFLVRVAQMNVVMSSNAPKTNIFHINSLEFPSGYLDGLKDAARLAALGTMDVVMTNPPFGSDIPITDPVILKRFDLAQGWEQTEDGGFRKTGRLQGSVAPEVLFIERCIQWLKPGGRMGIVLPDGILGNPGDEYIRWWILRHCWVLASVDLPVEVFIVEAGVNILTSLLLLKKKPDNVIRAEALGRVKEYPIFMAVAEKVGYDRRGNKLYKRGPEGEEILEPFEDVERIRLGGKNIERRLSRMRKIEDNDLPEISKAYEEFRKAHPAPGP